MVRKFSKLKGTLIDEMNKNIAITVWNGQLGLEFLDMTENRAPGFSSRSIHAGYHPDPYMGSINVPIYASTTFQQDGLAQLRGGFEYGRVANPTVRSLELTLASLENAEYARCFPPAWRRWTR